MKIRTPLERIEGQITNGMKRLGRKVYKTKENPYEGKKAYFLGGPAKTVVFANPGADIEKLKEKYLTNY